MKITKEGLYTTYHDVAVVQGGLPEWGTEWWVDTQWKEHEESEKRLHESGEWGKLAYYDISIMANPMFGNVKLLPNKNVESHSLIMFDFSKNIN